MSLQIHVHYYSCKNNIKYKNLNKYNAKYVEFLHNYCTYILINCISSIQIFTRIIPIITDKKFE